MRTRTLGSSQITVSAIGFGCWAIGGPFLGGDGKPAGWGEVDDQESIAAIRHAIDTGITFFDTANAYGVGHSETVLGQALADRRDEVVIATKFGNVFDAETRAITGTDASRAHVEGACADSLRRLGTDRIDLYQLHTGNLPLEQVDDLLETLEGLVTAGKIRAYGWSTDDPDRAKAFAAGPHCVAVQHNLNVLDDAPAMLDICSATGLASINRGPLAMGLLSGKYTAESRLPDDDVRGDSPAWMRYFSGGRPDPEWLTRLTAVREVLTGNGRTLAQGALGWILARHPNTIPIPGLRTVAQVTENAEVLRQDPLTPAGLAEIDRLLDRAPVD
jgi:aryl-alcohol dehydrogenase-like predicted oxidoreductase